MEGDGDLPAQWEVPKFAPAQRHCCSPAGAFGS